MHFFKKIASMDIYVYVSAQKISLVYAWNMKTNEGGNLYTIAIYIANKRKLK